MDDWVILSPTRWKLKKAIRAGNQCLEAMQVRQHPDKTFVGRVERGFDFLGYQFDEMGLPVFPGDPSGDSPRIWRSRSPPVTILSNSRDTPANETRSKPPQGDDSGSPPVTFFLPPERRRGKKRSRLYEQDRPRVGLGSLPYTDEGDTLPRGSNHWMPDGICNQCEGGHPRGRHGHRG